MEIKLGQRVRDAASGFSGIAIQLSEQLSGSVQIGIQPQVEDGATMYPDAVFIDVHMIEFVDEGISARVTPAPKDIEIKLGNKVKDIATGFTGIAIEKATYMNGCVYFGVLPKKDDGKLLNENSRQSYVPVSRLEVVNEGITAKVKEPKADASGKKPGGPARRIERMR